MKSISSLAAIALLAACTTPSEPQVVYRDKEVKIPVREKCTVEIPAPPKWETEVVSRSSSWVEYVKAVLIELEQRRDYQQQLEVAASKCK